MRARFPEVVRVGYFGSYAVGNYVPGSDLDMLLEVRHADAARRADRSARYRPERFPVGVELFVYTSDELQRARREGSAFIEAVDRAVCWLA